MIRLIALLTGLLLAASPAVAETPFAAWLRTVRPEVIAAGITASTFDSATQGLEPDLSLPDLVIPGRRDKSPGQPEFVLTPSQYLKEATLARLAMRGRELAVRHREVLDNIAREFGVPGPVLLAIWGRETDFGGYKLPYDAIRVLATQAFTGRRKDMFRAEFIAALRMLQDGIPRTAMRSSWGGAMGLTQFLPSEFYKYAVDFDGDGRIDIWNSVADALASAARQLVGKGWQPDIPWAIEVRAPANVDCTTAEPGTVHPVAEWLQRGFKPAYQRDVEGAVLGAPASLLLPEGLYGPGFLATANYFVIKDYNFSDLYVLFVGNLSDRIGGGKPFETPWSMTSQLRTSDVEVLQRRLTALGFYKDKIDGKAGMLTRAAVGAFQKANRLKVDCWPTTAVLGRMRQ